MSTRLPSPEYVDETDKWRAAPFLAAQPPEPADPFSGYDEYESGNWDGDSAEPIAASTLATAKALHAHLQNVHPDIAPGTDGTIGFQWGFPGGRFLIIEVGPSERCTARFVPAAQPPIPKSSIDGWDMEADAQRFDRNIEGYLDDCERATEDAPPQPGDAEWRLVQVRECMKSGVYLAPDQRYLLRLLDAAQSALAESQAEENRLSDLLDKTLDKAEQFRFALAERQAAIDAFIGSTHRLMEDGENLRVALAMSERKVESLTIKDPRELAMRETIHGQGLSMVAMSKELREKDAEIKRLKELADHAVSQRDEAVNATWQAREDRDKAEGELACLRSPTATGDALQAARHVREMVGDNFHANEGGTLSDDMIAYIEQAALNVITRRDAARFPAATDEFAGYDEYEAACWDGDSAEPITASTLSAAKALHSHLQNTRPDVAPGADGTIGFQWHFAGNRFLLVEVGPGERYSTRIISDIEPVRTPTATDPGLLSSLTPEQQAAVRYPDAKTAAASAYWSDPRYGLSPSSPTATGEVLAATYARYTEDHRQLVDVLYREKNEAVAAARAQGEREERERLLSIVRDVIELGGGGGAYTGSVAWARACNEVRERALAAPEPQDG